MKTAFNFLQFTTLSEPLLVLGALFEQDGNILSSISTPKLYTSDLSDIVLDIYNVGESDVYSFGVDMLKSIPYCSTRFQESAGAIQCWRNLILIALGG